MNSRFIKPDYKNSNVNISATLAEFLGAPNKNAILPDLMAELQKGYKNVVFICFDGLGMNPIEKTLDDDSYMRSHIVRTLTSTFPSTTTNATTSLLLNKVPLEHGWFGWSINFENIDRNVDIFMNTDSWTGELLNIKNLPIAPKDYYFDNAKTDYDINTVFPKYVEVKYPERNSIYDNEEEFFAYINMACKKAGKQFVYAYYPDPDYTMHRYGVDSMEARYIVNSLSKNMKKLVEDTMDTIYIVTADHGQIDIDGYINLYEDEKLLDMLTIYPYLEARAPAFKVKAGRHEEFEKYFREKYSSDFELYKSSELIENGYFGDVGDKGHLLGDYIGIIYTNKHAVPTPNYNRFKGHHTSLTEEMLVPLMIFKNDLKDDI